MSKSTAEIRRAFSAEGYKVGKPVVYAGQRGFLAEHRTARHAGTQAPKRAIYVEGSAYEMGYLVGLMCEPDVWRMADEFVDKIIPMFISPKLEGVGYGLLIHVLQYLIRGWCRDSYARHPDDLPRPLVDEMRGITDGCKAANSKSRVTYERVLALNVGVDCLVSALYTGMNLKEVLAASGSKAARIAGLPIFEPKPEHFQIPVMCNGFVAFGRATGDRNCYLGRDFQFPNAGVYDDTACLIIYNPTYKLSSSEPALPMVSQSAPGFVGSVTAVNSAGVGIGVDMVPSGNCDPNRPGLNSVLMVRHAAHSGYGAQRVVDTMVEAQRGASWIYVVGDGANNQAVVVEAGMTTDKLDYLKYSPRNLKPLLPTGPFLASRRGLLDRWDGWKYPTQYLDYNRKLFKHMRHPWIATQFGDREYLNANWKVGLNQGYYFAPQRESRPNLVVATNHYLIPEMRLCSMNEWCNIVTKSKIPDIQWRYDELNRECLDAYGHIGAKARDIIDFLSPVRPNAQFQDYYGDSRIIEGSVSLCNLTERTIESHFGCYEDDWVKLTLPRYV